jgi:hypothetical protein
MPETFILRHHSVFPLYFSFQNPKRVSLTSDPESLISAFSKIALSRMTERLGTGLHSLPSIFSHNYRLIIVESEQLANHWEQNSWHERTRKCSSEGLKKLRDRRCLKKLQNEKPGVETQAGRWDRSEKVVIKIPWRWQSLFTCPTSFRDPICTNQLRFDVE